MRGQWDEQRRRNHLGGFGFRGDRVFEPVVHFSGGERARLALAILVAERPNLLLLDEPTNHLDFEMRHSLITALQEFAGAVIVVSHDRGLLRSVCDQFWLVADGAVRDFDGDLEDYAGWLEKRSGAATTPVAPMARDDRQPRSRGDERRDQRRKGADARRELAPKRQEIKTIETSLAKLGQERTRLETELPDSTTARNAAHARKVTERHAALLDGDRATGDTLARTIRAVRILTMADEPDATPIDPSPPPAEHRRNWHIRRVVQYGFLALWALVALWNLYKPLPDGTSVRGDVIETPLNQLHFLYDLTSADVFGAPVVRHEIFDVMLDTIAGARQFIVVDFFLFNGHRGAASDTLAPRALSAELRDALLARKRTQPGLTVLVISDPINDVYGSIPSPDLAALRDAGIEVVVSRPRRFARLELHLLGVLAPHHEMVGRRRLGGRLAAESAGGRPRGSDVRSMGPAAQLQGQSPQGADRG